MQWSPYHCIGKYFSASQKKEILNSFGELLSLEKNATKAQELTVVSTAHQVISEWRHMLKAVIKGCTNQPLR